MTSSQPVQARLARYYEGESGKAGSTFLDLAPHKWRTVTASDLVATSLLDVAFTPSDVRRLLQPGPERERISDALHVLPDVMLATADTESLAAMNELYLAVLDAVAPPGSQRGDRWVVASKLCARKRPDLFPIRDAGAQQLFGTTDEADHRVDWQLFRHVIADHTVTQAVDSARQAVVEGSRTRIDTSRLRLLDVALWTWSPNGRRRYGDEHG